MVVLDIFINSMQTIAIIALASISVFFVIDGSYTRETRPDWVGIGGGLSFVALCLSSALAFIGWIWT